MKQMTKEEAVHKIGSINEQWDSCNGHYAAARALVESLDVLGLWTPTEPKSVEDEAVEALTSERWEWTRELAAFVIADLKAAGFTVTKAVK